MACAGPESPSPDDPIGAGGSRGGGDAPLPPTSLEAVASCDELLDAIQARLIEDVRVRQEYIRSWNGQDNGPLYLNEPYASPAGDASNAPPSSFSWLPPRGVTARGPAMQEPIEDMDAGDILRLDGDRLYVLDDVALNVLATEPIAALRLVAALPIEGVPLELVARDGRVAVFSRIEAALPGSEAHFAAYTSYQPSFIKVTLIDAREAAPRVMRELYVEGTFRYARRHGALVSGGIQQLQKVQMKGPSITYVDLFGRRYEPAAIELQIDAWAAATREAIETSTLEDYLPTRYERIAGELVALPLACSSVLVPPTLPALGMTSVISIDLNDDATPFAERSVPGFSTAVYADDAATLLQRSHFDYIPGEIPRIRTELHLFERADGEQRYVASGEIGGQVVRHPYSIDVDDGVIRIAAWEELFADRSLGASDYLGIESRVQTLGVRNEAGQRALTELGRVVVGTDSHYIYSTRFSSDRALLVSWPEQPTELLVLDLADPTAPTLAGRLAPQSYSSVFVPLPDEQFLSIGHGGTLYQGYDLALQVFDTATLALPRVVHEHVYPAPSASYASFDGRALALHPSRSHLSFSMDDGSGARWLEVARLSDAGLSPVGRVAPVEPPRTLRDCLALVGAPTDPEYMAAVEASAEWQAAIFVECSYYPLLASVERGLFLGDYALSVTRKSVAVHALDALDGPPVSQVDFPRAFPRE
jgi:hypothetical protein